MASSGSNGDGGLNDFEGVKVVKDGWSEKVEYGVYHNVRHPTPDLTMNEIIAILSTLSPHLNPRMREEVQESAPKAVKEKHPKRGRPKGSVNKNRKDVELSPFQTQLQGCIRAAHITACRSHDIIREQRQAFPQIDGAMPEDKDPPF